MYVLGPKPMPKTVARLRGGGNVKREPTLVNNKVILGHNGTILPRTNPSLDKPSRGLDRQPAIWKDFLGSPASIDNHCKNKVQRRVLKYLRRKLLPPH